MRDTLKTPVSLSAPVVELLASTAEGQNVPFLSMPSGAAHDAMIMQRVCPTGMIFVRSRHGLSHCPEEYSSPEDLTLGTQLLLDAVLKLARTS